MIKNILFLILTVSLTTGALAQRFPGGPPANYEEKEAKIKAHKIAFITEQLNLSPEEAQAFWPVFNEYSDKDAALKMSMKSLKIKMKQIDTMSDEDLEANMKEMMSLQKKEVALLETYHPKFVKAIGVRKTALLYKAEHEFKKVLLKRLRGEGPPPPPR